MGIESEPSALSMESIPKSMSEVVQMETTEAGSKESSEPPERAKVSVSEKNGL